MKNCAFFRASTATGVLALALLGMPVHAQTSAGASDAGAGAENQTESEAQDDSTILVTGIRSSLNQAVAIKRNADSVVDAISAEDVGRFPDVNIAESVQRITGVQINRTRGEGRTVNIRGLPANFTQTTFNGRVLPNAAGDSSSSRTFDFMILPAEFVKTLSVYKSPTADLPDGGLAGTIDVRTPRPFDVGRRVLSASAQAEYETNSGKLAPRLSGFYSDTFADERLGLSVGLSYTRRKPETNLATAGYSTTTEGNGIPSGKGPDDLDGNGIIEPNQRVRIINEAYYYLYNEDNERLSGIASLQFRPTDTLTFSLDGFYSRLNVKAATNEFIQIFANANTVVSSTTEVIDGLPTTTRFRVADLDMRGGSRFEDRTSNLYSIVGGAEYEAGDWLVNVAGSYADSRQEMDNLNIADIATGDAEFVSEPGDSLFSMNYYNGFDERRLDPDAYRLASLNGQFNRQSLDRIWDIKADVSREFGDQGLTAIRFGGQYSDEKQYQDNNRLTITAAGVSALAGGLPAGPTPNSFSAGPFMRLITPGSGSFLGSYSGDAKFPTEWLSSDVRSFVANFTDEELVAASPDSVTNDATGITDVQERTLAGYARADFAFGPLTGNVGLRGVRTQQVTVGVSPDLTGITLQPEAGSLTRVPASAPVSVERSYWDYLPSANLRWELTDDLLVRFGASRTITRPNLDQISPTTTVNAGAARTVTLNNPYLDPFRANNLDATVEWYFNKSGLLGASFFYKDLRSLIRRETTVGTLPVTYIYTNGTTQLANLEFNFSNLVNGRGVEVKGVELYYQQAFTFLPAPFDGFGGMLNYTFIDNSDPMQLTAASRHNFNAIGYYEKGPIGVRLSYSWRSGFLSSAAVAPAMSEYTQPFGTLDGSINLKFTDRFSLVLEAVNILDTDEKVKFTNGLMRSYLDSGRRVFGGVRFAW